MRGRTPLHVAAGAGHAAIVALLVERGAAMEARALHPNSTPLYAAAQNGHGATVRCLLEHGANAEAETRGGMTPLHEAAFRKLYTACHWIAGKNPDTPM